MPSRDKSSPEPPADTSTGHQDHPAALDGGKGRPTPKRKQAEAANKRPLVQSDRKAAMKAQRAKARLVREREYTAMRTGDEKSMPVRDRGPVRRWVRDYVDARRNLGEHFLPVSLVVIMASFLTVQVPQAALIITAVLYLFVLVTLGDAFLLSRSLKKSVSAKFGPEAANRSTLLYGVLRAFQIRRTRLPKPKVKRGEFPA